jgi:hypothetical protein
MFNDLAVFTGHGERATVLGHSSSRVITNFESKSAYAPAPATWRIFTAILRASVSLATVHVSGIACGHTHLVNPKSGKVLESTKK